MRGREAIVNTLLGIFLISVLFLPFLLGIVVLKYAVPVIDQELWILFPTAAHPAYIAFIALLSLLALISGVTNLRKRRWRDAFLCLAILPMIASIRFAGPHSMFGIDGSIWVWPWLIVTAAQSGLNRSQFFLAGAVIGAVVAINAGLLGAGTLCRVASYGVLLVSLGLAAWSIRSGMTNRVDSNPQSLLPTRL
jgi:hypothetical protein